ncbi:MAG TPA: 1,4-alpha-glucan branching protein GlgB, partial [Polyangiaceae bacterium]|nr:1,4-alpha-glucan branching protein GlgB [Polyangiaceae bacterium]
ELRDGRDGAGRIELRTADVRSTSELSELDSHLFHEGTHTRIYEKLGAHLALRDGVAGTHFAVWAPNARRVSLIGDFNGWNDGPTPMQRQGPGGIWTTFVPKLGQGSIYKYRVFGPHGDQHFDKADPYAFHGELPPSTGSVVWDLRYEWQDGEWMRERERKNAPGAPISIYELHLGSWRRVPEDKGRSLNYREIAPRLVEHVKRLGFSHVELMPVMDHPFYGSWGYQVTGYFAPSARFGTPQDLMFLIDTLHANGIGVILDWVPAHFPKDGHSLNYFDGTHLYEHADPRQGEHPEWGTVIYNYGRHEVRSFLTSSAMFWLDRYHADGLRVDGVSSMLYLDYGRQHGQWLPNVYGGRENLEAVEFLRHLNGAIHAQHHDVLTIAEESTAWPLVTAPAHLGGLGFDMKWDMGWMHDTLHYMQLQPIHRKYHHNELTFRRVYAYHERFVLPLSHDEVVYGKGSLLRKMPGDDWQRYANLRLLLAYMFATPGKPLLFMGAELGQYNEWNHDSSVDWHLEREPFSAGVLHLLSQLNRVKRESPALYELDFDAAGFDWIDANDSEQSTLAFLRHAPDRSRSVAAIFNFTPVPRHNYRVGVSGDGFWEEVVNTDAREFGGSGQGNLGGVEAAPVGAHGRPHSLNLTLPPLGAVLLRRGPRPTW